MEPKLIQTWLDVAPAYLNFLLRFPQSPRAALSPYLGKGTVVSDLTTLLLAGVGLSYLILVIFAPPTLAADPSPIVRWFTEININLVPPAVVLAVIVFACGMHLSANLFHRMMGVWDKLFKVEGDPWLGGRIEDTINAAIAFASIFVPFAVSCFVAALWVPTIESVICVSLLLLPGISFVIYFPLALAGTHPETSLSTAWSVLAGAVVFVVLIIKLATWIGLR